MIVAEGRKTTMEDSRMLFHQVQIRSTYDDVIHVHLRVLSRSYTYRLGQSWLCTRSLTVMRAALLVGQ
jgi:hypothetical protein